MIGVLADCEANFSAAVFVGETRQFFELFGIDAAGRNAEADGDESGLRCCDDTEVIGVAGAAHVFAAEFEFVAEARDEFASAAATPHS